MLYIVNTSAGWRLQEHAPAVPCDEVVDLPEEIGEPAAEQGYLIPDYPTPYLQAEHRAKFAKYREDKKPEAPERKEKPAKKKDDDDPKGQSGAEVGHAGQGASVPLVITQRLRRTLRDLGHTDEQIDRMTPQQAHDAANPATPGV